MKGAILMLAAVVLLEAAPPRKQARGTAGEFDYYLLSMSWSPHYCSTPAGVRDKLQCGGTRRYEFVLHGLWPQYEKSWPQYCDTREAAVPSAIAEKMLDIMPSRRLIAHEWERHGSCSGFDAAGYFAKARAAFTGIKIPAGFVRPATARTISPSKIRAEFIAANPGMPEGAVSVNCTGRFLSEVRVCLTKELKARACSAQVERQACRLPEVIVQPLR